jgi:hypothetical protein
VCDHSLLLTRLSCDACGTELSGSFAPCEFCALSPEQRDLLRVFLSARGNMKELERHLGVSYPTARARFDDLLTALGLGPAPAPQPPDDDTVELLAALARGELTVDEVDARLS